MYYIVDVDECQDSRIVHYCSPNRCVNTEGSYRCECKEGFKERQRFDKIPICVGEHIERDTLSLPIFYTVYHVYVL